MCGYHDFLSIISFDAPCKDGNSRIKTISLIKYEIDINVYKLEN